MTLGDGARATLQASCELNMRLVESSTTIYGATTVIAVTTNC